MLDEMFRVHLSIQQEHGHDPRRMDGPTHAAFIRDNALLLINEVIKSLDEVHWKPWEPYIGSIVPDRERYLASLVEAWHFMMNLILAGAGDASADDIAHAFADAYIYKREMKLRERDATEQADPEPEIDPPMTTRVDVEGIVLPCGHVIERPTGSVSIVTCHCNARWQLILVEGGRAWNAIPIS